MTISDTVRTHDLQNEVESSHFYFFGCNSRAPNSKDVSVLLCSCRVLGITQYINNEIPDKWKALLPSLSTTSILALHSLRKSTIPAENRCLAHMRRGVCSSATHYINCTCLFSSSLFTSAPLNTSF